MVTLKTNTPTNITIKALNVVLQHALVPSLGWCPDALVERSAKLYQRLREHFSVDVSNLKMSEFYGGNIVSDLLDSLCSGSAFHINPMIKEYTNNWLNSLVVPNGYASEMVNDIFVV